MRKQIQFSGVRDGYQTKFYVPVVALERLRGVVSSRQISKWLSEAVKALQEMGIEDRHALFLQDSQLRNTVKETINVRLSLETQADLREMLVRFRSEYAGVDLDTAGVVRAAIFLRLRREHGWLSSGLMGSR